MAFPSTRRLMPRLMPGMIASVLLTAPLLATPTAARAGEAAETSAKAAQANPRRASVVAPPRRAHLAANPPKLARPTPVGVRMLAFFDETGSWHQTGIASWYGGPQWQGHPTASGVRYEQDDLTAAHAFLPLGARVRVHIEGTNRSVVVLINDRIGTRTRIIDLSRGAARALGILDRGLARVTLSLVPAEKS